MNLWGSKGIAETVHRDGESADKTLKDKGKANIMKANLNAAHTKRQSDITEATQSHLFIEQQKTQKAPVFRSVFSVN